jgi:serine/threonine protein phosphatase PrpC
MIIYQYSRASVEHPERCEDTLLVVQTEGKAPIFAVIDGMGGHQHQLEDGVLLTGRDASQFLATALSEQLSNLSPDIDAEPGGEGEQMVVSAIRNANAKLYHELNQGDNLQLSQRVGAVLTVVVLCENGERLLCVQVGDTRAYLFTQNELIQICYDEDNIEYMVELGMLSASDGARISNVLNLYDGVNPPQAEGTITINGQSFELYIAWHWFIAGNSALGIPPSNVVVNALGIDSDMSNPQISRIQVANGDTLFMCSDGLYKNMNDSEIISGLQQQGDSATGLGEAAYQRSQDSFNRRRTVDDISALVVTF